MEEQGDAQTAGGSTAAFVTEDALHNEEIRRVINDQNLPTTAPIHRGIDRGKRKRRPTQDRPTEAINDQAAQDFEVEMEDGRVQNTQDVEMEIRRVESMAPNRVAEEIDRGKRKRLPTQDRPTEAINDQAAQDFEVEMERLPTQDRPTEAINDLAAQDFEVEMEIPEGRVQNTQDVEMEIPDERVESIIDQNTQFEVEEQAQPTSPAAEEPSPEPAQPEHAQPIVVRALFPSTDNVYTINNDDGAVQLHPFQLEFANFIILVNETMGVPYDYNGWGYLNPQRVFTPVGDEESYDTMRRDATALGGEILLEADEDDEELDYQLVLTHLLNTNTGDQCRHRIYQAINFALSASRTRTELVSEDDGDDLERYIVRR
ncbi:hypothetical protein L195_g037224, partial [Trifolium pratense]